MKRDMELVRKILIALEEYPHGLAPEPLVVDGYTPEQVGFNCHLMLQAGLIYGVDETALEDFSPIVRPVSITWNGYKFLENTKNPNVWEQTRSLINSLGGASFSVWSSVATKVVMKNLGLES